MWMRQYRKGTSKDFSRAKNPVGLIPSSKILVWNLSYLLLRVTFKYPLATKVLYGFGRRAAEYVS